MRGLVVALLLAAALAPPTPAAAAASGGFGVTPAQLDFTDPPLMRGSVAEGTLRVQNRDSSPTLVTVAPGGALAAWLSVDAPSEFTLDAGATRTLRVEVAVPATAPNGDHSGYLRLRARGTGEPSGSGATTQVELLPTVRVRITGDQVVAFALEQATIEDPAPDAPLLVRADIVNRGNVREAPRLDLVLRTREGAEVFRESLTAAPIPPAQKERVEVATTRGLASGLYTAVLSLSAEQGGGKPISIDLEARRGGASANPALTPAGDLVEVVTPPRATPGTLASFVARFANDGTAPIASAKLTVEVFRGDERIAVVTSDPLRAPVGETLDLEAFWEPGSPGEHTLKAYVTYDGIRTPVRQATFLVAGPEGGSDATTTDAPDAEPPPADAPVPGPSLALVLVAVLGALAWSRRRRA